MIAAIRHITVRQWVIWALANLVLVAAMGVLMRLKILLPMPGINQKFLLHAHSHFAFSGWVSHALMTLIVAALFSRKGHQTPPAKYQFVLFANLLASYGMLIGFFLQGYGAYSIAAAAATVIISYLFAIMCWRDMAKPTPHDNPAGHPWIRAALLFLAVSSIGTYCLAYLNASGNTDPRLQLASVYFFLHFQYNGWFFFACMGLIYHLLGQYHAPIKHTLASYRLFVLACPVNFLLSVLWWDMPGWLYFVLVMAVMAQSGAWVIGLAQCLANRRLMVHRLPPIAGRLFICVAVAATIKFTLQGLSVIPALSTLSYSFRPIVIGYLHLVLLGVISLFIMAYSYAAGLLSPNRIAIRSTIVFIAGVILNELLLMLQGIAGLARTPVSHIPLLLAVAAGMLLAGIAGLLASQLRRFSTT